MAGNKPLHLDPKTPSIRYRDFAMGETRSALPERTQPDAAAHSFMQIARHPTRVGCHLYERLARLAAGEGPNE